MLLSIIMRLISIQIKHLIKQKIHRHHLKKLITKMILQNLNNLQNLNISQVIQIKVRIKILI